MKVRLAAGRLALGVALGLALSLVGACGGDDDDGGGGGAAGRTDDGGDAEAGPPLSKEEFVAQANAVCRANDERVVMIAEEFQKGERAGFEPTAKEIQAFVVATLPEFRRMLAELALLTPPEADQEAFADLIDQGGAAVDKVEELKDDPEVLLSRAFGDAFATFNRGAFTLGLTDCGEEEEEEEGH